MINIFIIDDHQMVIEGIQALLQTSSDIVVAGTCTNAAESLDFLKNTHVDLVLLDINLPDMSGLDLCKIIKQTHPKIKILALSTFNQVSYVNKMLSNGASGYLLKNITKDELSQAIYAVMEGGVYHSFEIEALLKNNASAQGSLPILTKRETDILKLVVEGLTNPQIGERLFISQDTVDSHRKNLHTKLGVSNTASLVRFALENGLV
jgi:DNA-binding NarL/FixJ family response regulator